MRRICLFALVLGLGVAACTSPNDASFDGTWNWNQNANPGGVSIDLVLATSGDNVTGTGQVCGVGPTCTPGAVTIAGQVSGASFSLTLSDSGRVFATYAGTLVGGNELQGTWTESGQSSAITCDRESGLP